MSNNVATVPIPLKSISSIRNPTDGFGAPSYCSSSPMPRIWKYRARWPSPDQLRFGTVFTSSSKCCCAASRMKSPLRTVTLVAISCAGRSRKSAVTTISSMTSLVVAGPAAKTRNSAARICAVSRCFMNPFLRRHYPDQVLRVPLWISGQLATPVKEQILHLFQTRDETRCIPAIAAHLLNLGVVTIDEFCHFKLGAILLRFVERDAEILAHPVNSEAESEFVIHHRLPAVFHLPRLG